MNIISRQQLYRMIYTCVFMWALTVTVLGHSFTGQTDTNRERRNSNGATRSCKAKFKRIENHSACLPKSANIQSAGLSEADKQLIVSMHNDYRSKVSPKAADMLKVSWDDEIALIAQGWAENCDYTHDKGGKRTIPGRFSVGQNLGRGYKDWTSVINAWHIEKDDFTFGNKAQNVFEAVGHYTQMVWAKSSRIGCGFADCSSVRRYYVCNYGPAGNIGDFSKPYLTGASTCGRKFLKNNLCECDKDCLNGGKRNLSTCTCNCLQSLPFYVGEQCDLDCAKVVDNQPSYCGKDGGFNKAGCTKYENVPYHCPSTCDICPWGGVNYKEPGNNDNKGNNLGASSTANYVLIWLAVILVLIKEKTVQ